MTDVLHEHASDYGRGDFVLRLSTRTSTDLNHSLPSRVLQVGA
jgi:hypothetical protein